MNTEFLKTALKGNDFSDDVVDGLYSALERAEEYKTALAELEAATTNFILGIVRYLPTVPKIEFDALLPALTHARSLLEGGDNE